MIWCLSNLNVPLPRHANDVDFDNLDFVSKKSGTLPFVFLENKRIECSHFYVFSATFYLFFNNRWYCFLIMAGSLKLTMNGMEPTVVVH